ncbi:MAG: Transcriptional regulator, TetR family [Gammaproteobacteria bacterium]|nr:Transcriptional regulator, TetR family [Gammaproteobacteria bacterium]
MSTTKTAPTVNPASYTIPGEEIHCTPACAKPRVRDRIFETACDLFYKHGIRDVGVDMIATEAGTNKMSFYRSFASKDELVAEYLEQKGREFWVWWDGIVAAHHGDARGQIEALFDAYVTSTCFKDSRGCAFANASVEIADEEHPARHVAVGHKVEMRRRFRELATRAGAAKADELGDALMLLMEGGYLTRRTFEHGDGPLQTAALTARVLLDAYTA